jgi:hypothetical protein
VGDDEDYAVDFDVVDDGKAWGAHEDPASPRVIIPPAPVHPLSSLVTIAIDQVWGGAEAGATASVVGIASMPVLILTSGAVCFVAVGLIQRYVEHDPWGPAIAKAFGMAVLAAVPYQFVGTAAGAVLLGWAGIHSVETFVRRMLPRQSQ